MGIFSLLLTNWIYTQKWTYITWAPGLFPLTYLWLTLNLFPTFPNLPTPLKPLEPHCSLTVGGFASYFTDMRSSPNRTDSCLFHLNISVHPPLLFWRHRRPSFFMRLNLSPTCEYHLFLSFLWFCSISHPLSFVCPSLPVSIVTWFLKWAVLTVRQQCFAEWQLHSTLLPVPSCSIELGGLKTTFPRVLWSQSPGCDIDSVN